MDRVMSEAPERIGLVSNGLGGFALWNREDNKFDPAIEYVRADLFDAMKAGHDALEARVKELTEALSVADYALLEAEAILGGEYSDHYQPLCDTMTDLRNKIAALQENTDDR